MLEIGRKVVLDGCFEDADDGSCGAGAILFDTEPRGVVEIPRLTMDERL